MTKKKLFKTVITLTVLHEQINEVSVMSLDDVIHEMNEGRFSAGTTITENSTLLVGIQAANAVKAQGSGVEFFNMDDKGNELVDEFEFLSEDEG